MGKHKREPWADRERIARELMEQADVLDYETIRYIAKESDIPVKHLIVQTDSNEPTYAGRAQATIDAQWFVEIYHQQHWEKLHIRGCHYKLDALRAKRPNGEMYKNDDKSYAWLGCVASTARYLHLIPLDALEDHKNGEFVSYFPEKREPGIWVTGFDEGSLDLDLPEFPEPPSYKLAYYNAVRDGMYARYMQRYRLEVWIEKSGAYEVIEPLCRKYEIGFQSAMGQMSLYRVHQLVQRIKEDGRPCIIFYLSDFDHAGNNMPVTMGNKLNWCLEDAGMTDREVKLFPVALTEEQVNQFQLPRAPQKATIVETELFAKGVVELDALEALVPGELRKIVIAAISIYYDEELAVAARKIKKELQDELDTIEQEIHEEHQDDIDEIRAEHDQLVVDMQDRMNEYKDHVLSLYDISGKK